MKLIKKVIIVEAQYFFKSKTGKKIYFETQDEMMSHYCRNKANFQSMGKVTDNNEKK